MKTESETPQTPTPVQTQPAMQYTTQWGTALTATTATTATAASAVDTGDVATLNDALGSAGVDLRDRSKKQPITPSFDTRFLGPTICGIRMQHKITKVPEDSVNYLALALRARLQDLFVAMIAATRHCTDTQYDKPPSMYEDGTPMWSVVIRSDLGKQLAALEKTEREEEMKIRRECKERTDLVAAHAANLAAQVSGGGGTMAIDDEDGGAPKKKKKKEGPSVTARNMSEDVRKKMSNAVASQAAGLGGKYAWMTAANAPATTPKPKPAAAVPAPAVTAPAITSTPAMTTAPAKAAASSSQAAEEDDRMLVTMRDAMFVIVREKGHGGGCGSARGWV
ncbi:transcription initiation factor TFIID component TAF4 family-domain-containing protein [Boletus coccyginus]|nr:transcription initiation factor TFIID component TAF4 family-domain-containing protein [Boletus coccyginus]